MHREKSRKNRREFNLKLKNNRKMMRKLKFEIRN